MNEYDSLGDRLKAVEQIEAGRKIVPGFPIMARLDGRAFHTFTRGLARPFDDRLVQLMIDTTAHLVDLTKPLVGYTQSDEISLCWYLPAGSTSEYLFDGKIQKLTSVLASTATSYFVKNLGSRIPEKADQMPTFDCRVWQVADMHEVYLNFLWRQEDAVKNSISMAAQAYYSPKQLHKVSSAGKLEMLAAIGKPWSELPEKYQSGTFVRRVSRSVNMSSEQLANIPEKYRPTGPVIRSFIEPFPVGLLRYASGDSEWQTAMKSLFSTLND